MDKKDKNNLVIISNNVAQHFTNQQFNHGQRNGVASQLVQVRVAERGQCKLWWKALQVEALAWGELADATVVSQQRHVVPTRAHRGHQRRTATAFVLAHVMPSKLVECVGVNVLFDVLSHEAKDLGFVGVVVLARYGAVLQQTADGPPCFGWGGCEVKCLTSVLIPEPNDVQTLPVVGYV